MKIINITVSSVKAFRIDLAKAPIGEYCSCKRIVRPSAIPMKITSHKEDQRNLTAATTATITGESGGMKLYGTATAANFFVPQWKRTG